MNTVHQGKQEGRLLNCPTANITIEPPFPKDGVYSCKIKVKEIIYDGMSYYDSRRPGILESHLFDYSEDLYGKQIVVIIKTFIRSPLIFTSLEELKEQIIQDGILSRQDLIGD